MNDRYENIRKALEMGPTPGPWTVRYDYVVQASSYDDGRLVPVAQPYGVNCDGTDLFANAHLIAACNPDTIRELLAERDQLAAALEAAREDAERLDALVTLLEHARCNTCDGSGAFYDGYGEVIQCQWCHERAKALAAYHKQKESDHD